MTYNVYLLRYRWLLPVDLMSVATVIILVRRQKLFHETLYREISFRTLLRFVKKSHLLASNILKHYENGVKLITYT